MSESLHAWNPVSSECYYVCEKFVEAVTLSVSPTLTDKE